MRVNNCKQKLYGDDLCPSQRQSLAEDLQLPSLRVERQILGWQVINVPQVREGQMVRICLYVYVCVTPPMIAGVWSMAVMCRRWQ